MRSELQQFRNKQSTVSGRVESVFYKNEIDKYNTKKPNVRILIKDVIINGIKIDHIWLLEKKKFFKIGKNMINERVKFKAKIEPYVKKLEYGFQEDYGIKRESKIYLESDYNIYKPFKNHTW